MMMVEDDAHPVPRRVVATLFDFVNNTGVSRSIQPSI